MRAGQIFSFTLRCVHEAKLNFRRTGTRTGIAIGYVLADVKVYANLSDQVTDFGEVFPINRYDAMLVAG